MEWIKGGGGEEGRGERLLGEIRYGLLEASRLAEVGLRGGLLTIQLTIRQFFDDSMMPLLSSSSLNRVPSSVVVVVDCEWWHRRSRHTTKKRKKKEKKESPTDSLRVPAVRRTQPAVLPRDWLAQRTYHPNPPSKSRETSRSRRLSKPRPSTP